ncbi:ribosomal protein S12 methylthiotransferase accessory factor [Streptomyces sp. TLI_55]|uniref:YcaO-like family protein n=1 Tax=Streptomyces sp. TLI_55 TaxID=1938861 RepID=UPI000BDC5C0B|nr:YcaO-like family protein [Streptomyces sp. TLI_55]SNX88695.1 ribosomal protein S12 methylthiotransferase accessory factor [Streptomyces sp. TLI_55]
MSALDLLAFDGTVRACEPEATWSVLVPRLPDYGITRVADLTRLDHLGLPVWAAHRPDAHTLTVSQGKGSSHRLAAISAVMEAVELHHAEQVPQVDFDGPAFAVSVDYPLEALPLRLAPQTLPEVAALNRLPQQWTQGVGLLTYRSLLVPAGVVFRAPQALWTPAVWRCTSTGLACGNTRDEAIAHALFEVMERHALQVDENTGGTLRTLIDPASVNDPYNRRLIDRIHASGASLELYVVDNAFALPVCLAYLWSQDYPVWFAGTGCHSDPHIALSRAITEAAQSRLTSISGTRDDLPSHNEAFAAPQPAPTGPRQTPATWHSTLSTCRPPAATTFSELVQALAERLHKTTGYEPIAVTLSAPDAPLAAVKVVAPGTRSRTRRDIPR